MINIGIYLITAIAWLSLRNFYTGLLGNMFGLDEETISRTVFTYLGHYKLLMTFFNFTPWIVTLIID